MRRFRNYIENEWDDEKLINSKWLDLISWTAISLAAVFVIIPAIAKIITR